MYKPVLPFSPLIPMNFTSVMSLIKAEIQTNTIPFSKEIPKIQCLLAGWLAE